MLLLLISTANIHEISLRKCPDVAAKLKMFTRGKKMDNSLINFILDDGTSDNGTQKELAHEKRQIIIRRGT